MFYKVNEKAVKTMYDGFTGLIRLYYCNAFMQVEYRNKNTVRVTLVSYSTPICYVDCLFNGGIIRASLPVMLKYPPSRTTWKHVWKFLGLFYTGSRLKEARGKFDK